jgi:hypothetical protein
MPVNVTDTASNRKMDPLAFSQSSYRSTGNTERMEQEKFTTQMVKFNRSYSNTSEAVYTFWLGSLSVKSQSITLRPAIRRSDTARTEYQSERKTFTLRLAGWLSSRIIELQAVQQGSQWTFNLRPWQVVSPDSMLFDFCKEGDLRNIQRLFSKGLASPFDVTPDGDTALHVCILQSRLTPGLMLTMLTVCGLIGKPGFGCFSSVQWSRCKCGKYIGTVSNSISIAPSMTNEALETLFISQ